jgi:hypothetical protein
MILDLHGTYGSDVRPPRDGNGRKPWAKNPSGPGADDGTRLDATFINDLIGLIRGLLAAYGVAATPGDDTALAQAVAAAIANHTHSVASLQDGDGYVRMTEAERAKLAALVANYKGSFASLALLEAAYPTAANGDWAILSLPGEPASIAVWDADADPPGWVDIDNAPPQTASNLPFTPMGTIEATTVQGALEELDSKTQASLAVRLRVDAPQSLSAQEKAQARANIAIGSGPLGGFRNKIINGDGRINQRGASTIGDDSYGHDRHYALTQTGNITVSTLTAPAVGIASMMRLTQPNASAQRMGYAQIIEAAETYGLRGRTVTLGGKLRYSSAAPIRFAVLEWTGTADQVTSDVVNNWTSNNYTAGNFFAAGLTVAAVGSITPVANTITGWSIMATISSSANNLIVFYWTQDTAAQNATLDMRWYLVEGDATAEDDPFSPRHIQQEIALCQRYYEKSYNLDVAPGTVTTTGQLGGQQVGSDSFVAHVPFQTRKRSTPSLVIYSPATGAAGKVRDLSAAADVNAFARHIGTRAFELAANLGGNANFWNAHFTADAEL